MSVVNFWLASPVILRKLLYQFPFCVFVFAWALAAPVFSGSDTRYIGKYGGTKWSISSYTGTSPGVGILAFNLEGVSPSFVNNGPLFIKCKEKLYSSYYEAYRAIPSGSNVVSRIYDLYCR